MVNDEDESDACRRMIAARVETSEVNEPEAWWRPTEASTKQV